MMAGFFDWAGLRWRDRDSFFGGITFLAGLWNVSINMSNLVKKIILLMQNRAIYIND